MFVNAMSVAMNHSSKLSCMRSSFVYDLACRSISESRISGGPGTLRAGGSYFGVVRPVDFEYHTHV